MNLPDLGEEGGRGRHSGLVQNGLRGLSVTVSGLNTALNREKHEQQEHLPILISPMMRLI